MPDPDLVVRRDRLLGELEELSQDARGLRGFMTCMERLVAATEAPQREDDVIDLLEQVLDDVLIAIDAEDGSLLVPDEATRELVFVLVRGDAPETELVGRRIPPGKGVAAWVVKNRRATIVNNPAVDDRFYGDVDEDLQHRTHSILAAPLIGGGRVLGVVEVLNRRGGRLFSTANQSLITLMCRFAGELLYAMVKDVDLTQRTRRQARATSG